MKWKMWVIVTTLAIASTAWGATNDLSGLLQKGLFEEEANRNLDAAVQAYQSLVTAFDRDRKLAATAVFRLGECYRKLGKTNEAVLQYDRIVREFGDEVTLATLSRQNLAGLGSRGTAFSERIAAVITRGETSPSDAAILKRIEGLPWARVRQVLPTLMPDELLTKLLEQYQTAEAARVQKTPDFGPTHPEIVRLDALLKKLDEQIKNRMEGIIQALEIRVAAAPVAAGSAGPENVAQSPATTDDEGKEIRRLQAMLQNSPDLMNAPSGQDRLTPLCRAASKGQLRVAEFLLGQRVDVNRNSDASPSVFANLGQQSPWTPLHFAAFYGQKAMVELLLARGAETHARDEKGRAPLHWAAEKSFRAVAEALVAGKANPNARNDKQETPLHLAAAKGHVELVKYLISKGAEVDARDSGGQTPLLIATSHSQSETIKALLAAKANPGFKDSGGNTALSYAAGNGQLETVKALLEAKADPNEGQVSPLLKAIQAGRTAVVQALLEAGADANRSGQIVRAHPTVGGQMILQTSTPLSLAVVERKPEAVGLLLQHKADPNGPGADRSPVILNAVGNADILKALLEAGADVNARTRDEDRTALHVATGKRDAAMTKLLLAYKADVNARDKYGLTPLDIANGKHAPRTSPGYAIGLPPLPGAPSAGTTPEPATSLAELLREHGAKEGSPTPEAAKPPEKP